MTQGEASSLPCEGGEFSERQMARDRSQIEAGGGGQRDGTARKSGAVIARAVEGPEA